MMPEVVIFPILNSIRSVNHSAPSGPAVIPDGQLLGVGTGNSVTVPEVVMRPILLPFPSANHKAPSEPAAIPAG